MEYTTLGRTGLRVSRLALGTAVFGLAPTEDGCDALVHAALDAGINVFDCANTYGNRPSFDREGLPPAAQRRHAEELLGKALAGHRDDVVLCTKVSEPTGDGPNDSGLSRYHIMREAERSLRRLGTDHIDIYHLHHPDTEARIEETLSAMDDLVRQGKVRYVGLSTFAGWQMTQAVLTADRYGLARPVLNQFVYNMINRGAEAEIVPAATELGVSLTCFSPLAGGALAGVEVTERRYSGLRRWGVPMEYTPEQKQAAAELDARASEWGFAPAHLALHWLFTRPTLATAIIGPESAGELAQNLGALDVVLDAAQLAALDEIGRNVAPFPF